PTTAPGPATTDWAASNPRPPAAAPLLASATWPRTATVPRFPALFPALPRRRRAARAPRRAGPATTPTTAAAPATRAWTSSNLRPPTAAPRRASATWPRTARGTPVDAPWTAWPRRRRAARARRRAGTATGQT